MPDPDLEVYEPDFLPSRTTYRYIHAAGSGGCEVVEGSVGGTGWRRLLQFATSDENVGERELTIGGVDYTLGGPAGELDLHNLYELSECHGHYHFKYYGDLGWTGGGQPANSKLGFCLQSTNRVANRETSPLHNPFGGCDFQGVAAGWVDQYKAGLPNQWLDTTDIPAGSGRRSFRFEPRRVSSARARSWTRRATPLAPGEPLVWKPTGLTSEDGHPVEAPLCEPGRSVGREQLALGAGEDRAARPRPDHRRVRPRPDRAAPQLRLRHESDERLLRVRARSRRRRSRSPLAQRRRSCVSPSSATRSNSPIPARYEDSWVPLQPGVSDQPALLANVVVEPSEPTRVTFTCPAPRTGGVPEPGGRYSIYTAPVFPDDPGATVARS